MPFTSQVNRATSDANYDEIIPLTTRQSKNFGTFPNLSTDHLDVINHCCAEDCAQTIQLENPQTRLIMIQQGLSGADREKRYFAYTCSDACLSNIDAQLTDLQKPYVFIPTTRIISLKVQLLDPTHKTRLRDLNTLKPDKLTKIISPICWTKTDLFKAIEHQTYTTESRKFIDRYQLTLRHNAAHPTQKNYLKPSGMLTYVIASNIDLSYLRISHNFMLHCQFNQCTLDNKSVLNPSAIIHTIFTTCEIRHTFNRVKIRASQFTDCDFTKMAFIDCKFEPNNTFSNCTFTEVNLNNSGLQNCTFTGKTTFINCSVPVAIERMLQRNEVEYEIINEVALLAGIGPASMDTSPAMTSPASSADRTPPRTASPHFFNTPAANNTSTTTTLPQTNSELLSLTNK